MQYNILLCSLLKYVYLLLAQTMQLFFVNRHTLPAGRLKMSDMYKILKNKNIWKKKLLPCPLFSGGGDELNCSGSSFFSYP